MPCSIVEVESDAVFMVTLGAASSNRGDVEARFGVTAYDALRYG